MKRFAGGSKPAVDSLTANILSGRVTGLVGPDGAGKTTLMRLFAGLMLPTSGTLSVCGADPRSDLAKLREAVSYMPQRFGLYEDLSVIENLNLYADLRAVVGDERKQTFERLLKFTDLAQFTTRLAGRLSGGMKQKLGLACALIRKPELLLLDEPSVGVDPISRRELWKMVYELVDQGIGVVWSTAYLDEAERCAEVLLLNEGQLLYRGDPAELTSRVTGRVFLLSGMQQSRRRVLAKALRLPEVIDGVVQGRSLRLVLADGARPPDGAKVVDAPEATMRATAPRFEDSFMDLLGGGPKGESTLADRAHRHKIDVKVVVEATGLTKRFGTFTAAENITFQIHRGEVFGLLGPNGAGKSTTFKMMCGLLRPTSGQARVVGLDLYAAAGAARARLGYMAQKFSLYGDLSVRQNLDFFSGVYGLSGKTQTRCDRASWSMPFAAQRLPQPQFGRTAAGLQAAASFGLCRDAPAGRAVSRRADLWRRSPDAARVLVAHQCHGRYGRNDHGHHALSRRSRILRSHGASLSRASHCGRFARRLERQCGQR